MTARRPLTLPAHGGFEMLGGLLTMAAPFVLGFEIAGATIAIVLSVVLVGLALAATDDEFPVITHHAADLAVSLGALAAAVAVGIAGDDRAAAFFAVAGVAHLVLNLFTRYTSRA